MDLEDALENTVFNVIIDKPMTTDFIIRIMVYEPVDGVQSPVLLLAHPEKPTFAAIYTDPAGCPIQPDFVSEMVIGMQPLTNFLFSWARNFAAHNAQNKALMPELLIRKMLQESCELIAAGAGVPGFCVKLNFLEPPEECDYRPGNYI